MMDGTRISFKLLLLYHVLLLLFINTCAISDDVKCPEKERLALLTIKKGLIDYHGRLSSWDGKEDCCNWRGIKCDNQTHHVTMLDLRADPLEPLNGTITDSLLELQHLTYLDLSYNMLTGSPVFDVIPHLTELTYLNLSSTYLEGQIPPQLGNLSNLQYLDLSSNESIIWYLNVARPIYNRFTSHSLSWISHLTSLKYLDMSHVDLSEADDWIQAINMLPSIVEVHLRYCEINSTIVPPVSLFNLSTSLSILDLKSNRRITSEIYDWLFYFASSSLVEINLSWNALTGPIPDSFGNMTFLAQIDLSYNHIDGGIPNSNFLHIRKLDMSWNNLNGNFLEMVQNLSGYTMDTLEFFNIDSNKMIGSVPDITIFSSMKELILDRNNLDGSLPSKFEHPSKLEVLSMMNNKITGSLPDVSVFPCLRMLNLADNRINGSLPESIGQLSKLEGLRVSSNQLQGSISEALLSNFTKLKFLHISNNHFILDFSSNWRPPYQLDELGLGSCKLDVNIFDWLQTQNNISYLDISNIGISDAIPSWFWAWCNNLWYLNLSYNNITGMLPDLSTIFTRMAAIDLSSNQLEGHLPLLPSITTLLNLSKNKFNGTISIICAASRIGYLDLSDNLLSGQLPDCWGQWTTLQVINLANNNLVGEIPRSIGFIGKGLISLHLRNNSFSGELPSSFKTCTQLITIDVSDNQLSGNVPAWIGENLSKLIILKLSYNVFNGSLPVQLCYLKSLIIVDISVNNITGTIPECFNNLTSIGQKEVDSWRIITYGINSYGDNLIYDEKAVVAWKGRIYEFGSNLGLMKSIDLSSNKLTGEIPHGITNLTGMRSLNLSRNYLEGRIPSDISRLQMLECLDLSRNRFTGDIPRSMSNMATLNCLDLSHNKLSGKIPPSTQLQGLDASSFSGNLDLCGPPLTPKCPGEYTNEVTPNGSGDEEDTDPSEDEHAFFVLDKWFYASIVLGFIIGFWGICGTLILKRSWRYAYFRGFDNCTDWLYVRVVSYTARLRRKIRAAVDRFFLRYELLNMYFISTFGRQE